MFLLFFALKRIMNLAATSSAMESNIVLDFYTFHDAITQLQFIEQRGPTYSDLGVAIRCAHSNEDQSSIKNTVHYLTTGGASLKFTARK